MVVLTRVQKGVRLRLTARGKGTTGGLPAGGVSRSAAVDSAVISINNFYRVEIVFFSGGGCVGVRSEGSKVKLDERSLLAKEGVMFKGARWTTCSEAVKSVVRGVGIRTVIRQAIVYTVRVRARAYSAN